MKLLVALLGLGVALNVEEVKKGAEWIVGQIIKKCDDNKDDAIEKA